MRRPINPGILYGVAAYAIWGLLPAFLKLLKPLPAPDILAWRILFSLLLLAALASALRHGAALRKIVATPRLIGALTASSMLIAINWLVYIIAVNGGHVAQASLGYFINPLVNVLLGTLVLRERLGRIEAVAVALAGVRGRVPRVRAGRRAGDPADARFLVRHVRADPQGDAGRRNRWIVGRNRDPGAAVAGLAVDRRRVACRGSGILAAPRVGRAHRDPADPVRRRRQAGALQRPRAAAIYRPTLQLMLAVMVYGEVIGSGQWVAFALIWLALVIYAVGATLTARRARVTLPE